jgi:RimJ/RimL family protein N-acetyltransferase
VHQVNESIAIERTYSMLPPMSITTSRLLLRAPLAADSVAIFQAYAQDPEVTRYNVIDSR